MPPFVTQGHSARKGAQRRGARDSARTHEQDAVACTSPPHPKLHEALSSVFSSGHSMQLTQLNVASKPHTKGMGASTMAALSLPKTEKLSSDETAAAVGTAAIDHMLGAVAPETGCARKASAGATLPARTNPHADAQTRRARAVVPSLECASMPATSTSAPSVPSDQLAIPLQRASSSALPDAAMSGIERKCASARAAHAATVALAEHCFIRRRASSMTRLSQRCRATALACLPSRPRSCQMRWSSRLFLGAAPARDRTSPPSAPSALIGDGPGDMRTEKLLCRDRRASTPNVLALDGADVEAAAAA